MEAVLVAATGPVVAGVLAALGFWWSRRAQERDRYARHERVVSRVTAQIAALEQWIKAHEMVAGTDAHTAARQQAMEDLEQARHDLADAYAAWRGRTRTVPQDRSAGTALWQHVRTVLMLDIRPTSWQVRTLGFVYYLSLTWTLLWLAAGVMFAAVIATGSGQSDPLVARMGVSLGIFAMCLVLGIAPALVLRWTYGVFGAQQREQAAPKHTVRH